MKPRTVSILFSAMTAILLVVTAVLARQQISHHPWLGLALTALSFSVAANPEFVLQDARRVLSLAADPGGPMIPPASMGGMLLSLIFLATWLYLTLFAG